MKLSDIKEFVIQPDGSIRAVVAGVVHELPNGEVVKSETVAIKRCGLGEHCRCAKGDEPGCWNWPE